MKNIINLVEETVAINLSQSRKTEVIKEAIFGEEIKRRKKNVKKKNKNKKKKKK